MNEAQNTMKLFTPIKIGSLKLPNRLVMAPMATNYSTLTGNVTQKQIDYYVRRARSGLGMIIAESNYVVRQGRGSRKRLGLTSDDEIALHRKLIEAVQREGTYICAQLHHAGATAPASSIGEYPVSCSSVALMSKGQPFVGVIPRTLAAHEIEELVGAYGQAARRAAAAGFDAIQIHAAHGYLINQFLSPHTNRRDDKYGGSPAKRMNFLLEIVDEVRRIIGANFPLTVRLSSEEEIDGGYKIDFIREVVRELENHGIDEVNLSAGNYEEIEKIAPIPPFPEGCYAGYAEKIKAAASIPVGVAGRIRTPQLAEEILQLNKADIIYLGREMIADPDWPDKARTGQQIRECIYCNRGCFDRMLIGDEIMCTVNYEVGREGILPAAPAAAPYNLLVAGGGPAGMSAAITGAEQGLSVTLAEAGPSLGGQLKPASVPEHKKELRTLISFLENKLRSSGVRVLLNQALTPALLEETRPDAVIAAVGASPIIPRLPGVDRPLVLIAADIFQGQGVPGDRVVVIGGGLVGVEIAEYLADQNKKVTIVEMAGDVLPEAGLGIKKLTLGRLSAKGVRLLIESKLLEVKESGVVVERLGQSEFIAADNVVLALGYRANPVETESIPPAIKIRTVGDAVKPRSIMDSIHEGAEAVYTLRREPG
ncbi:NAD(P)/FAD-dependent oxidoreductase [Deltaproteobacteria bacterium OttesenSCG-928-M10]|nr:NAD(P)/FAD-dependent oxidoreductase [Deltaproteobacteria bacterium OttesenSCG-928-M10]